MWLAVSATIVLTICIILILRQYQKVNGRYNVMMESYHNLEELNSTLRMQRHDYLNHLQVVYGLLEVDEYEELKAYLAPVYKDMLKTGKALRTSKPAVNALLRAKYAEAENENIDVYVEVKSDLQGLDIPDWELCKVLSNILDNAITALKEKSDNRKIMIDITESKAEYIFEIANNGPAIELQKQEEIFKQGVTTKQEEGHGMGLYITGGVVKRFGGQIKLTSDAQLTTFRVVFPKKTEMNER